MKKRFLSILLAMVMAFSILPTASLAAGSVEEALGEIDIYNGGQELSYLMINGRVRTLIYTYYNLSLIHISEPTRQQLIAYYVLCL